MVASDLTELFGVLPVGGTLPNDFSCPLWSSLEYLAGWVLRRDNPEWDDEALDGFDFRLIRREDEHTLALAGAAILIRDQTMTPCTIRLRSSALGHLECLEMRLGYPGSGLLGISGPPWNSTPAIALAMQTAAASDSVPWVYNVVLYP